MRRAKLYLIAIMIWLLICIISLSFAYFENNKKEIHLNMDTRHDGKRDRWAARQEAQVSSDDFGQQPDNNDKVEQSLDYDISDNQDNSNVIEDQPYGWDQNPDNEDQKEEISSDEEESDNPQEDPASDKMADIQSILSQLSFSYPEITALINQNLNSNTIDSSTPASSNNLNSPNDNVFNIQSTISKNSIDLEITKSLAILLSEQVKLKIDTELAKYSMDIAQNPIIILPGQQLVQPESAAIPITSVSASPAQTPATQTSAVSTPSVSSPASTTSKKRSSDNHEHYIPNTYPSKVIAKDQQLDGSEIIVDKAIANERGWIAVQPVLSSESLGPVIGYAPVYTGLNRKIPISIDRSQATPKLALVMYYDRGRASVFDYPGEDEICMENGIPVGTIIAINALQNNSAA